MNVRPIDVAGRLGVSKQLVNAYIDKGMPLTSYEDAEAWYHSKVLGRGPAAASSKVKLAQATKALEDAWDDWQEKRTADDPGADKSFATYEKARKALREVEKDIMADEIMSKEYIRVQTAIERFGRVLAQVREEMTQFSSKVAAKANPDNPGRAMKVMDEEVKKMLERLSASAAYAEQAVVSETDEEEPTEVADDDSVDEVEQP